MKNLLFVISAISLLLSSCNNVQYSTEQSRAILKPDTSLVVKIFISQPLGEIRFDALYRIIKDTVKYVSIDSNTQTKRTIRDTMYYIPIKRDSTRVRYQLTLNETVYEGDDLQKAVDYLTKWKKNHKQYFTKDSTAKK